MNAINSAHDSSTMNPPRKTSRIYGQTLHALLRAAQQSPRWTLDDLHLDMGRERLSALVYYCMRRGTIERVKRGTQGRGGRPAVFSFRH